MSLDAALAERTVIVPSGLTLRAKVQFDSAVAAFDTTPTPNNPAVSIRTCSARILIFCEFTNRILFANPGFRF